MADNDDDNLRIFDDVENVVKEVQEEEQTTAEKIDIAKTNTTHEPTTSTTNEVVDDCREEEQRPAKRVKVTAAASSVPVKSIVASYVPVSTTNVTSIGDIIPPPPPAYNNLKTTAQPQQQPPLPQNPNAQIDTPIKPHQLEMEALSDNIKLIPTTSGRGGRYAKHRNTASFTTNFTQHFAYLGLDDFESMFRSLGYRMVEFNQESNKWEDVGVERTTYLLKHRRSNHIQEMDKDHLSDVVKQNEAAMKEEEKGNFLHNASSNVTGGNLSNPNGTHTSNANLVLDAVRGIKKHHPKDVGKKPKIVDLTSGEFGFHSADLPKEGHIIKVDKYKNHLTMNNNGKYSKVLSYADIDIGSIKPANIVIIDLPYAPTNGGHHAGNCNVASSAGHVEKNQRYGVNITLSDSMILLIHVKVFIIAKRMLPAEGGWLLVKSMRDRIKAFDLPLQIQRMLNDNGLQEMSRVLFPSSSDNRTSTLHLELNNEKSKSYMQLFRTHRKTISNGGMPTMRLHEYEKTILPQAISDAKALVIVMLRKCKLWMDNSDAFFAAIALLNPKHAILQSSRLFFGVLEGLFTIKDTSLVWNVNVKPTSLQSNDYDSLEKDAYFYGGLQLKLANVSFIYFSELLKVHQSGKNVSKYKRVPALTYAKIPRTSHSFYTLNTVERLFENVKTIQEKSL